MTSHILYIHTCYVNKTNIITLQFSSSPDGYNFSWKQITQALVGFLSFYRLVSYTFSFKCIRNYGRANSDVHPSLICIFLSFHLSGYFGNFITFDGMLDNAAMKVQKANIDIENGFLLSSITVNIKILKGILLIEWANKRIIPRPTLMLFIKKINLIRNI